MIVFENEFFTLISEGNLLNIQTRKLGFDMKNLNRITLSHPVIHFTNFNALKEALHELKGHPVTVGVLKPEIEVTLSPDKMEARAILNVTAESFEHDKVGYTAKVVSALAENRILYGLENLYDKPLAVQREIIVARGTLPVDGLDSEIHLYEMKEKKPRVEDDGHVNHYELSLIESVEKGDWLGEMTPPTPGTPGKNVLGEEISPKPGKVKKLLFDARTVAIYEEENKTVLRALVAGALRIDNGKVKIDDLLLIKGNVDYVTGNIHFGGSVSIQGTVLDNFSVIAHGDISINSPLGVGAVSRIESVYGSIYIKGGIFGKSVAKIKAEKDVFLKYCNETEVVAKGDINIGFYSLNSTLTAQNILLDPSKGRIIGGTAIAGSSVQCAQAGNPKEIHTYITIKGFDRERMLVSQSELIEHYQKLRQETALVRLSLNGLESNAGDKNLMANPDYVKLKELYEVSIRELIRMEGEQKQMKQILSTKGEGSLTAYKGVFPKTHLNLKHLTKYFEEFSSGVFYYSHGELIQE